MSMFYWRNGLLVWAFPQTGETIAVLDREADKYTATQIEHAQAMMARRDAPEPGDSEESLLRRVSRGLDGPEPRR
jgi:hypothetical protein